MTAKLSPQQRNAIGWLAHLPWGAPPRRPATWKTLIRLALVKETGGRPGERGLLLTDGGKARAVELDVATVRDRVLDAIARRGVQPAERALLGCAARADGVLVHVNSGGNALAAEEALTWAGYSTTEVPGVEYGVQVLAFPKSNQEGAP